MTDNVAALPAHPGNRVDATPAIRTPEQFAKAVEALHGIMSRHRDRAGPLATERQTEETIEELAALGEAIQSSPFVYAGEKVVTKGFVPKVVA